MKPQLRYIVTEAFITPVVSLDCPQTTGKKALGDYILTAAFPPNAWTVK